MVMRNVVLVEDRIDTRPRVLVDASAEQVVVEAPHRPAVVRAVVLHRDYWPVELSHNRVDRQNNDLEVVHQRAVPVPNDVSHVSTIAA